MSEQLNHVQFLDVIRSNKFVILDTETTGLKPPAEICQFAMIDFMGSTLMNTLVRCTRPIPQAAQAIHHITDNMVKDAPLWSNVKDEFLSLARGKTVIAYNATYDRHMMHCSDELNSLPRTLYHDRFSWQCAMLWYSDYWGEWDNYRHSNKYQRLTAACAQQNVTVELAHDALGDCMMTYRLIKKILSDTAKRAL